MSDDGKVGRRSALYEGQNFREHVFALWSQVIRSGFKVQDELTWRRRPGSKRVSEEALDLDLREREGSARWLSSRHSRGRQLAGQLNRSAGGGGHRGGTECLGFRIWEQRDDFHARRRRRRLNRGSVLACTRSRQHQDKRSVCETHHGPSVRIATCVPRTPTMDVGVSMRIVLGCSLAIRPVTNAATPRMILTTSANCPSAGENLNSDRP